MVRRIESFIRAVIWKRLRKPAWLNLCKRTETLFALGIKRVKSLSINIALVRNRTLTARAIGIYAVRKLIAQNRIGPIFKPLIRYLGFMFAGMRFSCKGRFTRRQRASLTVFSRGSVKLSTFTSDIDYSYAHVPLKFGVGCIKIWINRGFRNKHRIANKLNYTPYYKPRKSKTVGLTEEQKLRFKFELTPKLKATANQLKKDNIIANKNQYNRTNKSRMVTSSFVSYDVKRHRIDKNKRYLYKYLRWRGTNSYKQATRIVRSILRDIKQPDEGTKQKFLAAYVRIQTKLIPQRHIKSNQLKKIYNLLTFYSASQHIKDHLFTIQKASASRLYSLNYLNKLTNTLLNMKK